MCQQGGSRPYWKPSGKGIFPLQSLIFLAGAYTNCKTQLAMPAQKMQKEACAGTWHRLPFWAEMQKKRTAVSPAFPQSARRGRGETNGENLNIAKHGMVLSENPPVLFLYAFVLPIFCRSAASAGYTDTPDNQKHCSRLSFSNQSNSRR